MISVIMSAYNVAQYIEKAVKSVLSSTFKDIELIIVEDCSTDDTLSVIKTIQDNRIKIMLLSSNKGCGWARRVGIEEAKGEYVICIDSDDWISEDFLSALYAKAVETNADIVSGGVTEIYPEGRYVKLGHGDVVVEGDEKFFLFFKERVTFLNNKLIKTELYKKYPYCTRRFIEDVPTAIPLLWYANKVAYINNDGYFYRQRDDSLIHSKDLFKQVLYRLLYLQDVVDFFEEKQPDMVEKLKYPYTMQTYLLQIKQLSPTREMIEPYLEDWIEFTRRFFTKNI